MEILFDTIDAISERLDDYLQSSLAMNEAITISSNLTKPDGSEEDGISNKIVLTGISLRHEKIGSSHHPNVVKDEGLARTVPPMLLNIDLLITTNFSGPGYMEGLKILSHCLSFFQANPVFTQQNTPRLDRNVKEIQTELLNLSHEDLQAVMAAQKARMLPCAVYKLRTLQTETDILAREQPGAISPITR